jgi:NADH-quinone oxidoreductase subunit L
MVFLTFFGPARGHADPEPGLAVKVPLIVLAVLSLIGGFVELPHTIGDVTLFSDFMHSVLPPATVVEAREPSELLLQISAGLAGLAGIGVAYLLFFRNRRMAGDLARAPVGAALHRFWLAGWGFDWLYDRLLVRPYIWLAKANKHDVVDAVFLGIAGLSRALWGALAGTVTGRVRWYATGLAVGAVVIMALAVIL